jgi:hypothetical protein
MIGIGMNNCTTLYTGLRHMGWRSGSELYEDNSPQTVAMQKDLEDALIHEMVWSLERLGQCTCRSEAAT